MSIVNRQQQYNVTFICHAAASCFERDRFQSLVFCQLSRSLVSDVRVAWGDQCLAMGDPGDDSTDQWEADTQPGSEWQQLVWVRLARIHPPHPVSGVRSPPGPENNVSHLRSAPALTFNFKCVMNKTSVKTTLVMKCMLFQLKVDKTTGLVYLLMSMKFCDKHGMSIYACVCPCVQLTTHLKLPPMMSFIWIESLNFVRLYRHQDQVCIESDLSGPSRGILIMSSIYRFRFSMSSDGTKRIQPKKQTLDEAYCPPGGYREPENCREFHKSFFSCSSQLPRNNFKWSGDTRGK